MAEQHVLGPNNVPPPSTLTDQLLNNDHFRHFWIGYAKLPQVWLMNTRPPASPACTSACLTHARSACPATATCVRKGWLAHLTYHLSYSPASPEPVTSHSMHWGC